MNKSFLNRFMGKTLIKENFINEQENTIDQETAKTMEKTAEDKLGVPTTGKAAPDNKNALEVDLNAVDLKKDFGLPSQTEYYVWSKSKSKKIGDIEMRTLGNLIRKTGDPFTYRKEGDKFRVVSGPALKGNYKSGGLKGKPIGTRPIGALISVAEEMQPIPVDPDPQADPRGEGGAYRYLRYIDARTTSLREQAEQFQEAFSKFQSDWENKILKAKLQLQPDDGFFDKLAKSGEGVASMTQERKDALSNWKEFYAPGGKLEGLIEQHVSACKALEQKYSGANTTKNSPAAYNFYLSELVEDSKGQLAACFESFNPVLEQLTSDAAKLKKGDKASVAGHAQQYDKGTYKIFEELIFSLNGNKSIADIKKAIEGDNSRPTGASITQASFAVAYIINSAKNDFSIEDMTDFISGQGGQVNLQENTLSRGSLYRRRYRRY